MIVKICHSREGCKVKTNQKSNIKKIRNGFAFDYSNEDYNVNRKNEKIWTALEKLLMNGP